MAIRRARLEQLIDDHADRHVVFVHGPAGAGKTVLVAQWLRAHDDRCAWLAVDSSYDDADRLLHDLIEATEGLAPEPVIPPSAGLAGLADDGALRDVLASASRRFGRSFVVVLDGVDRLRDPTSLRLIARLVENPPEAVRLVLIARSKPCLGLERARMRGDMIEIAPHSLRFRRDEIEAFTSTWAGGVVDAAQLEQATLGWAAGLRLAQLEAAIDEGASAPFQEPDGFAVEYVREELLEGSGPEIRWFLEVTCWLPVVTGPLCSALAGQRTGRSPSTSPEIEAVPLLPVASRPGAFRYPPVLRRVLQNVCRRRDTRAATSALCQAAEACRRTGDLLTAIDLFLGAGRAAEAADACADLAAVGESALRQVDDLFRRRPEIVPAGSRWLPWRIRAAVAAGHVGEASSLLRLAEGGPANHEPAPADVRNLVMARAAVAAHLGDAAGMLACAEQLIGTTQRTAGGSAAESTANFWRVRAFAWSGELAQARSALRAFEIAADAWLPEASASVALARGWVAWCEGDVALVADAIADADAGQHDGGDHDAELALLAGAVHRERNRLGPAVARLQEATACAHNVVVALATSELARCHRAAGAGMEAIELAVSLRSSCSGLPPAVDAHLRTTEVRLRLEHGDALGAHAAVRAAQPGVDAQLLAVRVALDQAPGRAAGLLSSVEARSGRQAVEKALLRAQLPGIEPAEAAIALVKAIADGEPLGLVRTFLDEGAVVCRRISDLALESGDRALGRIAALARQELALAPATEPTPPIEQLTTRELAVLHMLPLRMSNREMADQMYVSINTLKTHIRAIYRKLEVPHRSAAVRRAKALELV